MCFMEFLNIMFASKENYNVWIYNKSNCDQTASDLNIPDVVDYFEKNYTDFPIEYLYKPCLNQKDAEYRLEIMQELCSRKALLCNLADFCDDMRELRKMLRDTREEKHEIQKQYRYLLTFGKYTENLIDLKTLLADAVSSGLRHIHNQCSEIAGSQKMAEAYGIALDLIRQISEVLNKTGILINPNEKTITVIDCEETSESAHLSEEIFDACELKVKPHYSITSALAFSFFEERILNVLISENPELFESLNNFYENYMDFKDNIRNFVNLIPQFAFYVAYTEFAANASLQKMPICRPVFDEGGFYASECAAITLLVKFSGENEYNIVKNDIKLKKGGAFLLSGPNQGGKTIYLKTLGTTAYLAKCGCYVFCRECQLPFYDNIFTHFVQKEVLGKSRLAEEIERIDTSVNSLSFNTLVLLNESFTSTRRKDSVELAIYYLKKFEEIKCSVGFVSHFYEIPEVYNGGKNNIISLRSKIAEGGKRTYEICENKGDGLAYAKDIAYSCGMTYEQIMGEIIGKL